MWPGPRTATNKPMITKLEITRPDDWHVHFRDGAMMAAVVPETARHFGRAIVMPNLVPPVITLADAVAYAKRLKTALPDGADFHPLMTLYLTDTTDPDDVARAYESGLVHAVKLYPAGATTNSDSGVTDIDKPMPVLERMAQIGLPLCVHGEVTDAQIDIFDREAVFIERVLDPLRQRLPELRIIMEHVTTKDGVDYIGETEKNLAGTLTTHHLIINRNHILAGGIRPHYYCLPVAKRELHRLALRAAATSGDARFFLGTDSAPHVDAAKETGCGCAGCFTATNTMSILAHVFEQENALGQLEAFASLNGPAYYGLKPNGNKITLQRRDAPVDYPSHIDTGEGQVTLFDPGFPLFWEVRS